MRRSNAASYCIGIDDTDTIDSPGTNQLARRIADRLPASFSCPLVLRHQLLSDPRIPFTSQNGSASLLVSATGAHQLDDLVELARGGMRDWYIEGSDPGLCVARAVAPAIVAFGLRCQREIVSQAEARALAREHGVLLEAFGGTEGGVIGALAAVGLLASGDDGRVVHRAGWDWPDAFVGSQSVGAVLERGVDEVRDRATNQRVRDGIVDVGKHLRPSYRGGRVVLFVEAAGDGWSAVRLP